MKKSAIILTLCMLASLAGCGKADSVEESKPLNIQKSTVSTTEQAEDKSDDENSDDETEPVTEDNQETVTTDIMHIVDDGTFSFPVTTVKTGESILVKRTGNVPPSISPSRGTVVIPYASNVVRTTKTTAVRTTKATVRNTTTAKTGTTTSTTGAVTTAPAVQPSDVTNGDITCRVQAKGIEIIRKGKVIQLIETDTKSIFDEYADGMAVEPVTLADYDFDGYDDLYIKQGGFRTPNLYGVYMHYNPETKKFETWEQLSGINTVIWTDEKNQKLNTSVTGSAVDHESWTYIWNDDKQLQLIENSLQYAVEDDVFIDYFEYPDGVKTLVRREQLILDDEQNIIDTIQIPLVEEPTAEVTTEAETTTATKAKPAVTTSVTAEVTTEQ